MHELGIAQNIIDIVRQAVPRDMSPDIRKVRIRIGEFAGVIPDSLDFCFGVIAGESGLPKAVLAIETVPTICRCRDCGRESPVEAAAFICSGCGGSRLEVLSGNELEVVDIEVADTRSEDI